MRIKHKQGEYYSLQSCYVGKSQLFKGVRRWYFYKLYHSKAAALKALSRVKEKYPETCEDLIWQIRWYPHLYAAYEDSVCVYTEDTEVLT